MGFLSWATAASGRLSCVRLTSWSGPEEHEERWSASGNVVGFLILQDRDEDGEYESVAHIWTAALWRRRGIAAHLLEQGCAPFPVVAIEGPPTELGAALVSARAAHLGSTLHGERSDRDPPTRRAGDSLSCFRVHRWR